jgi:integrase
MPAKRKKEKIAGRYYSWLLGKRSGIYVADGRSNARNLGRHSLATRDRDEALQRLARLDLRKAVENGLAPRNRLETAEGERLSLEEGQQLYLQHVSRPPILGGATAKTVQRYRAVLAKFVPFAQEEGVHSWQEVTRQTLQAYGAWLDDQDYGPATEYLELTTLKQILKWLASENRISPSCLFTLPLKKVRGTTTYCYTPAEVQAMVAYCRGRDDLVWLGEVIVALATTGLRISELAALRWVDIDLEAWMIHLSDQRFQVRKDGREDARTTKSHRDRALPIHADLQLILQGMVRHPDGLVFHGPHGGRLKPDTVRNVLTREVLTLLASQFPAPPKQKGFQNGRLHSFRHFFCSQSANSGVPAQVLMTWLGHRDSKMVQHYYHLLPEEAHRQMKKVNFVGRPSKDHGVDGEEQPQAKRGRVQKRRDRP